MDKGLTQMSRKDKITITRTEDFSEIESELVQAMEQMDSTNLKIEAMLQEHAKTDAPAVETADEASEEGAPETTN